MGVVQNLIEPLGITIIFTFGTLINYRSRKSSSQSPSQTPLLHPSPVEEPQAADPLWLQPYLVDNSRFKDSLGTRFLNAFPFIIEIIYWNLAYWTYQLSRAFTALHISKNKAVFEQAQSHALSILNVETKLSVNYEKSLQQWTLTQAPWLMSIFAKIYYSHILVSVAFLVYGYTFFRRKHFQRVRRTMVACNLIAFIILSVYRVMPPRMLPKKHGFVDVLHPADGSSGSAWTHNKFQLTIAAMPSLHFGLAEFIAFCLIRYSPHWPVRYLAGLWPVAMLLTILATANHFLLDALVGALIPVLAWQINMAFLVLRPLEEAVFWVLRMAKPVTADQDPPAYNRDTRRRMADGSADVVQ